MHSRFISGMIYNWKSTGNRTVSENLIKGWQSFEQAISDRSCGPKLQAIPLPTGCGKTEAAVVWCASQDLASMPGILFVTKFKDEADRIQSAINRIANRDIAKAFHSSAAPTTDSMNSIPVLIITHEAYRNALRSIAFDRTNSWQLEGLLQFYQAQRSKIIIDEAFDWSDSQEIDIAELRSMPHALGTVISNFGRQRFDELDEFAKELDISYAPHDSLISDHATELLQHLDFQALLSQIEAAPAKEIAAWDTDQLEPGYLKDKYVARLKKLQQIASIGRVWTSSRGGLRRLHAAQSLIPHNPLRGVILDATARIDPTYELIADHCSIATMGSNLRRYENVKFHISTGHRVGKNYLNSNANVEWNKFRESISVYACDKDMLTICHKDVLTQVAKLPTVGLRHTFANWGALDGKNIWNDRNAIAVFGLPYLDDIPCINMCMAFLTDGYQPLTPASVKSCDRDDLVDRLGQGFIAKSVVQAINRIRCRTMVDEYGNCADCDVWITLPNGAVGEAVLQALRSEMPGAAFKKVQVNAALKKVRQSPTKLKLLRFLRDVAPGIYTKSEVAEHIAVGLSSLERVVSSKKPDQHKNLELELRTFGAEFKSSSGRSNHAYFTKH